MDPAWDAAEAEALYNLLEREVIPAFYTRDERGIPRGWVARMRESMARLTPLFSANRVVRQYTEQHYLFAASGYKERAAANGAMGRDLLRWQSRIASLWPRLRFGSATLKQATPKQSDPTASGSQSERSGQKNRHLEFQVQVFLDDLEPGAVRVELYAEGLNGSAPERHPMTRGESLAGTKNAFVYGAQLPATRPAADYTPRIVPYHSKALVPLEAAGILWHESPSWR
jgi:starch phosphorylase